jgi:rhodanese-related sulfurtransferase
MPQEVHYTQLEEHAERPKTSLKLVCTCFLLVGLGAVLCRSLQDKAETSAVNLSAMMKPVSTGVSTKQIPGSLMPRGAGFARLQQQAGHGGLRGSLAVARGNTQPQGWNVFGHLNTIHDRDNKFHYANDVDLTYEEIPAGELEKLKRQGWVLLDVRAADQVARAKVQDAVNVPVFLLRNDTSPYGLYLEANAWALGGWWTGAKATTENPNFVQEVMKKVTPNTPGVIIGCQTGLRSKQAMKELHLAGFQPKLAMIKGGFDRVKAGELCSEDECILPQGAKIHLAGSGNVAGMLGWKAT